MVFLLIVYNTIRFYLIYCIFVFNLLNAVSCIIIYGNILKKKTRKILTLIFNILFGGLGTLIYGLEIVSIKIPPMTLWKKIKHFLFGIIQFVGVSLFLISFYYFFLFNKKEKDKHIYNHNGGQYYDKEYEKYKDLYIKGIVMHVIGAMSYVFSLF